MPIQTIYKLRAQRPDNVLVRCGQFYLSGEIFVDRDEVFTRIPLRAGTNIGYYLPTAKVKNNIKAMKPLFLHKSKGYIRLDTKEILLLTINQEFHFYLFLSMTQYCAHGNCRLEEDSSIVITTDIEPGTRLLCYYGGWEEITKTSLPQYKQHLQMQQKYAFKRKTKEKRCMPKKKKQCHQTSKAVQTSPKPRSPIRDSDCFTPEDMSTIVDNLMRIEEHEKYEREYNEAPDVWDNPYEDKEYHRGRHQVDRR